MKRFVDRIGVPGLGLGSIRLLNAEHGRVEIPLETPSKMPSKNAPKKMPSKIPSKYIGTWQETLRNERKCP
jgi:hypothetical protein